ncbi:TM2 domain-containing protein CG10795 isoform X2 [Vespa velutina]|uniref:TM2 domain-containing protein CG10795 isoform X2 n=1 Tax=Vespa velutina TaxID=202808 RepID=UPI001FB5074C|nr:TM2 domain-containing protein CG10795 isoform X2 [Vespa velutina]
MHNDHKLVKQEETIVDENKRNVFSYRIRWAVVMCRHDLLKVRASNTINAADYTYEIDCNNLRMGQYICPHPDYDFIDQKTQQPKGCTKENKARVLCLAADGLICTETRNNTFKKDIPCKWTNGYSFETTLLLSIFLDVILIATQIVGPADGSHYVMPYYGAGINIVTSNNFTYRVPQYDS